MFDCRTQPKSLQGLIETDSESHSHQNRRWTGRTDWIKSINKQVQCSKHNHILFVNTRNLIKHTRIAWHDRLLMRPRNYTCCPEKMKQINKRTDNWSKS